MDDGLKKFVSKHRQEFDSNEPNKELWDRIDARMDAKEVPRLSSKWLSKFIYPGFCLSVVVIAVYFIAKQFASVSENKVVVDVTDSLLRHSEDFRKMDPDRTVIRESEPNEVSKTDENRRDKNRRCDEFNSLQNKNSDLSNNSNKINRKTDTLTTVSNFVELAGPDAKTSAGSFSLTESPKADEYSARSINEKKKNDHSRTELFIPGDPEDLNTYTATLYDHASLCALVRAYKFPGKVNMNTSFGHRQPDGNYRIIVKTTSCSRLEDVSAMKAIWLKGKTDKALTISVKRKLKNIVLIKRDGREISPEAISHYYRGQGVITDYKGKYFKMVFKNRVGLLLFFKDLEEGDKIIVDDLIEAVVKNQP